MIDARACVGCLVSVVGAIEGPLRVVRVCVCYDLLAVIIHHLHVLSVYVCVCESLCACM